MTERGAETSPSLKARMAGVFYVLASLTSVFGQLFVPGMLVVSGDAAATAANILGHEPLFRLGLAAAPLAVAFDIVKTVLFYDLFKPVSSGLSLLAAFFSLVALAFQAISSLFQLAPLVVLGGGQDLGALSVEQLQALALMFLKLRAQAFDIFLVFFGFWCVLIVYLIFRSTFLPRLIGRADGLCRFGLPDASVAAARKLPNPPPTWPSLARGNYRCSCGSSRWA